MARARILAEEGKLDESLAELERAKRRAPEEVDVFLALAEVLEAKNEFLAAADALNDSVLLSPRGSHARAARAVEVRLRLLSGDVAGAGRAIRKVRGPERARLARAAGSRRKSAFIRGFPALRQLWDYCGPAVLAMLLKHWGLPGRQLEIGFDVWDGGTPLYLMKSYSRRCGLFAWSFRGDLRRLKRLVELGVPCVLDVVRDGERHYLVAVGYDGRLGEVIFRDPSELGLVWMSERELRAAWEPGGSWTLAVVPRRMRTSIADAGVEPDEGVERAEKACSLFDRGRYKQALVEARRARRRGGGLLAARLVYMCLAAGGRWRDARKEAARLREEFPGLDWTLAAEGEALWAMGELALAAKLLRKTRSPAGRLSRAGVLFQMGRNAQAAREVEEVLRLEPDSAPAHALLGRVHLKRGENGKAFDEYGKAVELCPGDARIVAELGYALEKRNEFAKAERALRRAARLDARDPWVLNQLAYFLAEHGRSLAEAVRLARKALRLEREDRSYVHDTLGWALLKRGRLKEGLKWLRLAEKGDDGTDPEGAAEVLYHVAVGLKRAGKAAQAEAKLRKAARLKGEYARRAREELS
jgi:tetratricopeptide (TPR) repeat protein